MDKGKEMGLFVNDGHFMERVKQLQKEKGTAAASTDQPKPTTSASLSVALKPTMMVSKMPLEVKFNDTKKGNSQSSGGKLAFSLKQKTKVAAAPVKFITDEDEETEEMVSGEEQFKRQKLGQDDIHHSSSQPEDVAPFSPSDSAVKKVADKLASFVAKNGRQFEHVTRQRNPGETPFKFLFDPNCSDYKYYEHRLLEEEKALAHLKEFKTSNSDNRSISTSRTSTGSQKSTFQQHLNYQTSAAALYGSYEESSSSGRFGMDDDLVRAPKFDDLSEFDDLKFISSLSTILVASIQEVKDRVSQIEFVFCSQLFPGFQMTSRALQKKLADTRKLAEEEWKEKERALLQQVKDLQTERQQFQEEVQQLNNALEQTKTRLMSAEQSVDRHEQEKVVLSTRLECLMRNEDMYTKLKTQFDQKKDELFEAKELQKKLSEEIVLNNQKLLNEQAKTKDSLVEFDKMKARYKQLKSQYMHAVGKFNHESGNECYLDRVDVENNSPWSHSKKRRLQDYEEKEEEEVTNIASQVDESKNGRCAHENPALHHNVDVFTRLRDDPHTNLAYYDSILPKNDVSISKSESIASRKKSSSSWRDTRAHETRGGDPHDNFLDTPLEIARNLNKLPSEPAQDLAAPPPQDLDFHNSDDETQDMNTKTIPLEQRNTAGPANKGFRYREPVRKKAERENLEGVECVQCKKFYDAVLPGYDNNPNDKIRRCEHHDGVSRHRYRYAPPLTPEGFWNIGFDSDM